MLNRKRAGRAVVAVAAIAAALAAGSGRLHAIVVGEDDDAAGPFKDKFCKSIGCAGGTQKCAEAGVTLEVPEVGKVFVTYSCYEKAGGTGPAEI